MKTGNQLGSDWLELSNLELDCNVPTATAGQVQLAGVGSLASGGPQPGVGQVLLGKPPHQHHHNCTLLQSVLVGELSSVMAGCVLLISLSLVTPGTVTLHS